MRKILSVIAIITALLLLCSCTLVRFESPEEQRRREQEASSKAAVEKPRPAEHLARDLVYEQRLENQAGKLLAEYIAKMPQFDTDNAHSIIFERINEYYQKEIKGCESDSEGFFQTVKHQYGEEWDVLEIIAEPFRVTYNYELLDTPENYICVMKTYVYESPKGSGYTSRYPDVFLAENGWKLEFRELFGSHADEANKLVMNGIEQWCVDAGVSHEKLPDLKAEDFIEYYAMDRQSLIFYAPPFMLSTNDKNSYEIRLDLTLFASLFVDGKLG